MVKGEGVESMHGKVNSRWKDSPMIGQIIHGYRQKVTIWKGSGTKALQAQNLPQKRSPGEVQVLASHEETTQGQKSSRWNRERQWGKLISSTIQVFEKRTNAVKNYGVVMRYLSRTLNINMYREYRDTSLCGAVSQLCKVIFNYRLRHRHGR